MSTNSIFLANARDAASAAFDEHCKQREILQEIAEPTIDDLQKWLSSRDAFFKAQGKFENIVCQISGG